MGTFQHRRLSWVRLLAVTLLLVGLALRVAPLQMTYAADTSLYENPGPITIPIQGEASPYPSVISVNDARDVVITDLSVELTGLSHTYPADIRALLVSPDGMGIMLLSGNGGGNDVNGITMTFEDAGAPLGIPLASGAYRPSGVSSPNMPGSAPPGPYAPNLASFVGQRPTGDWRLFVFDTLFLDSGAIAGGWALTITTEFPEIKVTPRSALTTSEDGAGTVFEVVLTTQPREPVFVPLNSSDTSEGTLSTIGLTFTPANWAIPQPVFVIPVDDSVADDAVTYDVVIGPAISADPVYDNRIADPAALQVTNQDNDTAGIIVNPPTPVFTSEDGGVATFAVRLTSEPTANVTIPLQSSDPTEGVASPGELLFTPANWNEDQTVTVTGVNDDVADGHIFYDIVVGPATSTDPKYQAMSGGVVTLLNLDNNSPGVLVAPTIGVTAEDGSGFAVTVSLNSEPTANVLIGLASSDSTEGTVSPTSLTFTPANWNRPQVAEVRGVDDAVADGNIEYFILTSVSSSDVSYHDFPAADVQVFNINDDGAGIRTDQSSVNTDETGASATISVRLDSQPTHDVTIPVSSSAPAEATVSPASLTFTAANWNIAQPVTITGVDDDVADGDQNFLITLGPASSSDSNYNGLRAFVVGTNVDDDTAGVTVNPTSGLSTTEAGGTASFTVVLTSEPIAPVTVNLNSSDPSEGRPDWPSLSFTAANWSLAQTVTVIGQDDTDDDGDIAYTIVTTVVSTDPNYNGAPADNVELVNLDDDSSSVIVELVGNLVTTETGGTASFTVRLASTPSADVSFMLSSSDTSEGTVAPARLNFTPANWDRPQTVTITGVDDAVADGDIAYTIITAPTTSDDARYNGLNPADVPVTNLDNDTAGVTLTPRTGITSEAGGTADFRLALTSEPTANVTITLASSDTSEGTISPISVTFTPQNWAMPQQVIVTGVDDDVDDGNIDYILRTNPATSADPVYNGLDGPDATLINLDDDGAGISVSSLSPYPTEAGGSGTFTVVLDSEPTDNVVINLSSSDTSEGVIDLSTLTFTPANWNVPQTVTVTGVDDDVDDDEPGYSIVLNPAISNDPLYDGIDPADVAAYTIDDDTARIIVAPISGRVTSEAGGTSSFTIVLGSEPTDEVTVAISSSDITEGTVSPASVTFTPVNWRSPQTVTIRGVDDDLDDGDQTYQIITAPAVSLDVKYNQLNPANVTVTNLDNDAAGITVAPTSGLFTSEAGGTATFTVVLNSRPSGDVSVGLSSSDTTEGTLSPSALTFTPAAWNVPQTVIVTGVDDRVDDGNIVYSIITGVASSSDSAYAGINPNDVAVTNIDDDTAGLAVTPMSGLFTSEAGGTASFTVALTSEPTDEVTVAISSSDTGEGTVSPANLTFTALNWNIVRTVVVTGVDDMLADGNQVFSIILAPSSGDARYAGLAPANVTVTNTDNEPGSPVGAIRFSAATYSIGEQGGTLVVEVNRVDGSSGAVTVEYGTQDGDAAAPADYSAVSGTLSWADGEVANKSISVPIVDDVLAEGNETFSLVLSAPTGGASLGSPSIATVTIIDNDPQPTVRFSAESYLVREDNGSALITVVRGGSTAEALTVDYTTSNGTAEAPGDYLSTSGTLRWSAGDSTPQSFRVTINADTLNEGNETVILTLRNPSAGAALDSPTTATLTIIDPPQAAPEYRIFLPLLLR